MRTSSSIGVAQALAEVLGLRRLGAMTPLPVHRQQRTVVEIPHWKRNKSSICLSVWFTCWAATIQLIFLQHTALHVEQQLQQLQQQLQDVTASFKIAS